MKRCLTVLGTWLLLIPGLVLAATTGSLKGLVGAAGSGEPIVGANIVLDGTTLGAATDINGVYYITNIPAGTYTVRVSAIGYRTAEITNQTVFNDLQATLDVVLEETAIEGEVVTIIAERPLIEIDKTSSVQITGSEELKNLPVRGYSEIIKIQSGVQTYNYNSSNAGRYYNENTNGPRISVRGSREDEVMFNVDGVSLNDPYSGFITFRVPDLAWDQCSFLKGHFSAEYGRYMSGVVNWTTKSADDVYHVEAEVTTDAIAPDKSRFDQTKYGVSLSGPLLPGNPRYGFFVAYEHGDHGDRMPSYVDDGPKDPSGTVWDALLGKVPTNISDNIRLDFGMLYSDEEWNEYRHSYALDLEHMPYYHDFNQAVYARLNHAVSSDLNYTLTANYTDIRRFRGDDLYRDNLWSYGTTELGNYDETALFWEDGRQFRNFMKRRTEYTGFRFDLQKLIGLNHDVRTGFETQLFTLRYFEHGFPNTMRIDNEARYSDINNFGYDENAQPSDDGGDVNGPREPVTMGFYLQDKIRLDYGLRFDLGIRWDYLDPAARRIKDQSNPFGDDLAWDINDDTEDTEAFSIWSPRLGVSFPATDKSTFHFNYGRYTQFPAFYSYYVDYDYFAPIVADSPYHTVMGSPNLAPSKTTSYEFGIDQGLGDYTAFAFTAYYKSIKDYVNAQNLPAEPSAYSTYFNMDRAVTKGLEFEFRLKPYKRFAAVANYTISWANGTGSSNNGNDRVAWTGSDPPKFTNPLVFDRRHHFSGVFEYRFSDGDGPRLFGAPYLENTTFGFNFDAASGRPYTKRRVYNEISLGATFPDNERAINSANIDWSYQVDFRLTRTFALYGADLDVFFSVINLFDTENYVSVWESSGDPGTTYWLETNEGQAWIQSMGDQGIDGEGLYRFREDDPNNWSVPRMFQVGLALRY